MDTSLDEAEFLIRSEHRIEIIAALAEQPHTRAELQDLTGVSRVTLSRSLGDMEDKRWIAREDKYYELRPLGGLALDGISTCLELMQTQQKLQDAIEFLPTDDMDLNLRHFADAHLTFADRTDTSAPVRRYAALMASARQIRKISYAVDLTVAETFWEQVTRTNQDIQAVLTTGALDTAIAAQKEIGGTDDDAAAKQALLDFESVFLYDGDLPYHLVIADETVGLLLSDERGLLPVVIESDNESVFTWAEHTFETYKREAVPLNAESLDV